MSENLINRSDRARSVIYYDVLAYFIIFLTPIVEIFLADHFLLKNAQPVIRYGLWAVVGIVGFMVALAPYRSNGRPHR